MSPRSLALPLVVCLLLAGCSALAPGPTSAPASPSPGTAETVTPAPVPEDRFPAVLPGVGDDGWNETERFRTVNERALGEGTYRARTVYQLETVDGGDTLARSVTQVRVENATAMRFDYDASRPDERPYTIREASIWVGPEGAYQQLRYANGDEETGRWNQTLDARTVVRVDAELLVETMLDADLRPTERYETDDGAMVVLSGALARPPRSVSTVTLEDPRNATLTARVNESGVVHAYVLEWRGTYDGEAVRATYAVRLGEFGDANARKPAWVERLRSGATNATTTPTPTPN